MSIDFFSNTCKSSSNKNIFGLCDDPPPATNPAYIDEEDNTKWIGIVENDTNKDVDFIAIDACINIRRENGDLENRCDGLLSFDNDVIFVELKSREGGRWLTKGREQLTITVNKFKESYDITQYDNVYGCVCNSLRPFANQSYASNSQKFFDDTGLVLKPDRTIKI